jgi:hypothetical protein
MAAGFLAPLNAPVVQVLGPSTPLGGEQQQSQQAEQLDRAEGGAAPARFVGVASCDGAWIALLDLGERP